MFIFTKNVFTYIVAFSNHKGDWLTCKDRKKTFGQNLSEEQVQLFYTYYNIHSYIEIKLGKSSNKKTSHIDGPMVRCPLTIPKFANQSHFI